MKIVKITIHNFLKLKDVEVNPEKVNVIVGKNKQGKTSILKAIQVAFTGKTDEKMIRDAGDRAEITLDLDEYKIERKITKKDNYLTVSNKDGWQVPAPQKFLDGLIGHFSFNPIEFFNLKSADKKKYLLQAIDIRLTPEKLEEILGEKVQVNLDRHGLEVIAELYKDYYSRRTQVNSTVSKHEKALTELQGQLPEGFDPSTVSEERVKELRDAITGNERNIERAKALKDKIQSNIVSIANIEEQIKKLEEEKGLRIKANTEMGEEYDAIVFQDTAELEKELVELDAKRELVHTHKQVQQLTAELEKEHAEQGHLDTIVKKLGKDVPDQLVREADLPVEGLKVEEDAVTVNGTDIENLSASEQLTLALAIVRKLNGDFKIINIDGVEILDKETFEWFLTEIEKDDFQYFITRVDGDKGWIVEDGKVTNPSPSKSTSASQ